MDSIVFCSFATPQRTAGMTPRTRGKSPGSKEGAEHSMSSLMAAFLRITSRCSESSIEFCSESIELRSFTRQQNTDSMEFGFDDS